MSTAGPPAPPPPPPDEPKRGMSRGARAALWTIGGLAGLVVVLAIAAVFVLRSGWFAEKVRVRIVEEVERASGGKTELGSFRFDWTDLTAHAGPFILRGTEPPGEAPLFRAENIRVGLKVISALKRDVDIASLVVEQPRLNLLVDENGITNLPRPKIERKSEEDPIERLLDLAIGEIVLRNGTLRYGDKKLPLELRGRGLNAKLDYDFSGPAYEGDVSFEEFDARGLTPNPLTFGVQSKLRLGANHIDIRQARLSMKQSGIELSGKIEDLKNFRLRASVAASGNLEELGPVLKLPVEHTGQATFTGQLSYDATDKLRLDGRVTGQHLAVREGHIRLRDVSLTSDLHLVDRDLRLEDLTVHALDGVFRGSLTLKDFRDYRAEGRLQKVSVASVLRMADLRGTELSGLVSGPVQISGSLGEGRRDLVASGRFDVAASQGQVPMKGFVDVNYSQRRNTLALGNSWLALPSTRLDFRGTLGEQLQVQLRSTDLNDLRPALAIASEKPPEKLPVTLAPGGAAEFDGTVTGPLTSARVAGTLRLSTFSVEGFKLDGLTATLTATPSAVAVSSFALGQQTLRLTGTFEAGLDNWKLLPASPLRGNLQVAGARIPHLLQQAGQKLPVEGIVSGQASLGGTVAEPDADLSVVVERASFFGEPFERVTANVRYRGEGIDVIDGLFMAGGSRIRLTGTYNHPRNDLKNGAIRFNVDSAGWRVEQVNNVAKLQEGLTGQVGLKGTGVLQVRNGEILPQTLDGTLTLNRLAVHQRSIGDVTVQANTEGNLLSVGLAGNLRGAKVSGSGAFRLEGNFPGKGELVFAPLTFSTIQDLLAAVTGREPMPVEGTVEGRLTFSGAARQPEQMEARLEIPQLLMIPSREGLTRAQRDELTLRNEGPVVLSYRNRTLQVQNAHFLGRNTDLRASGDVEFTQKNPVDLKVNGKLDLGVLQNFNRDVLSSGVAVVNASVRGTLKSPNLNGRMDLNDASLYLTDFPNGLDDINGAILFDQRRATIEKLTARTGGGDLMISGFAGFGGDEVIYRLQARADRVRIRYPEGVSTTANANLSLTGTSSASLLSGAITILRAGFNPRTDIGGILASAPTPVTGAATQNEILRNMGLDIRVETVPNLQFQTSLTADLQADADLRVRGTAARPAVLGRVVVSQGDIQFFGNKYTITRGEIGFYNPARIEPVLDLSLETRVRGVLVNINFSGTLQKLNVSYRSDPPLQSNEIIALLAVGRAPGTNTSLASSQTVTSSNLLSTGANSIVGQAVATPISGRLQRFFGVSRLKIDPQLTGLSAIPQARLTIEQQISRDITLTYVTNLSQANQQIIRFEWNLSRTWSVVAVREENGVFGVDFFFKKRFR